MHLAAIKLATNLLDQFFAARCGREVQAEFRVLFSGDQDDQVELAVMVEIAGPVQRSAIRAFTTADHGRSMALAQHDRSLASDTQPVML